MRIDKFFTIDSKERAASLAETIALNGECTHFGFSVLVDGVFPVGFDAKSLANMIRGKLDFELSNADDWTNELHAHMMPEHTWQVSAENFSKVKAILQGLPEPLELMRRDDSSGKWVRADGEFEPYRIHLSLFVKSGPRGFLG